MHRDDGEGHQDVNIYDFHRRDEMSYFLSVWAQAMLSQETEQ